MAMERFAFEFETGREQPEAKLELAADILNSIVNLVVVGDARGQITYVSPSAERILGYTPAELLGDGWWQLERGPESNISQERAYVMRAAAGAAPGPQGPRRAAPNTHADSGDQAPRGRAAVPNSPRMAAGYGRNRRRRASRVGG